MFKHLLSDSFINMKENAFQIKQSSFVQKSTRVAEIDTWPNPLLFSGFRIDAGRKLMPRGAGIGGGIGFSMA